MRVWKKLTVIALALMMVLAFGAVASADDDPATLTDGVAKDTTTANAPISNAVIIPKSIRVTGSVAKVYGPTVIYSYTISPATVTNITVNDGTNTARPVKAGVADGVGLSTVAFTSSELTLDNGSYDVTSNLTATVDLTKFTAPGIYRYEIKEATGNTALLYAAGVTRAAEDDFFLDVYIKYDSSSLAVYGFVLLNANESITTTNASTYKVSTLTMDTYATMDISVTKSVTGSMGDKTNEFRFDMTVSNSGMYFYSGKGTASETAANGTGLTTTLKDGETFVIKGLNPKATVLFTETNNTADEYTVSVQDNASTPNVFVTAAPVAASGTKATSALAVSNYDTENSDTDVTNTPTASDYSAITFINNLEAISPTGVVLRYAPYLAMMGAGIVALPLSLRKKEELD